MGAARAPRMLVALTVTIAVVASGCAWIPTGPGRPGATVRIVAPEPGTQVDATGDLPVHLELGRRAHAPSLRVLLRTGEPATWSDVTARFTVSGRQATATLDADVLEPGISRLLVGARNRPGLPFRQWVTSAVSWEPGIDTPAPGCDVLDPARCLLPFPSDHQTVEDPRTDTGRRVAFHPDAMPANASGAGIDPTEWNRNDGFSPGAKLITHVPGLDLDRTGAAPITDLARSLDPDTPILLVDAETGEAHLQWAELDARATSDETRALIVRPAANLREGGRYLVALRRLRDANGDLIEPDRAFRVYRDRIPTFRPDIEDRRDHMEDVLGRLEAAGVERDDLYLAWDFTVASTRNLSERMLHVRDDGFAALEGTAPAFSVETVVDDVDDRIWRRVGGTFEVPRYLTDGGVPGSRFAYDDPEDPDALPVRTGTFTANFLCNIPRAAVHADGGVEPARGMVYGHGLLGSHTEVNAGNVRSMADEHNMVTCATDWTGFAAADVPIAIQTLQDLSNFPRVADRTQQGFLNQLFLGRLIRDPDGFASHEAFRAGPDDTPLLLPDEVYYDGNSQGGILGAAVTAISTEWTRAVLGVPGMNYSTLLRRSSHWSTYGAVFQPAYTDELERPLVLAIAQMLWDRSEANGYAAHLTTETYPGTPEHQVLLHVAWADHQVAVVTADVMARTAGVHLRVPALEEGRHSDVEPYFGIEPVPSDPFDGSVMVIWDSGNPAPPTENLAPSSPEFGSDPHSRPRAQVEARQQKSDFLRPDGAFVDVCGAGPCLAP